MSVFRDDYELAEFGGTRPARRSRFGPSLLLLLSLGLLAGVAFLANLIWDQIPAGGRLGVVLRVSVMAAAALLGVAYSTTQLWHRRRRRVRGVDDATAARERGCRSLELEPLRDGSRGRGSLAGATVDGGRISFTSRSIKQERPPATTHPGQWVDGGTTDLWWHDIEKWEAFVTEGGDRLCFQRVTMSDQTSYLISRGGRRKHVALLDAVRAVGGLPVTVTRTVAPRGSSSGDAGSYL